ncbi:MAG: hypothetical protein OSB00_07525 [Sphingomonas bacterium]|nr:hypothetical protein [Sphingomonas bacterium]
MGGVGPAGLAWWIATAAAVMIAVLAGVVDWRRTRRADLDRIGFVDWRTVQMFALIAAAMAGTIAFNA